MTTMKISERKLIVAGTGALCAILIDNALQVCRREDQITGILVGVGDVLKKVGLEHGKDARGQGQNETPAAGETPIIVGAPEAGQSTAGGGQGCSAAGGPAGDPAG
jgi:hypothetical protein